MDKGLKHFYIGIDSKGKKWILLEIDELCSNIGLVKLKEYNMPVWCTFDSIYEVKCLYKNTLKGYNNE